MPPSMKTRSQPFLETLVTGTAARPSPVREQEWKDALDALKKEDHYILVMVPQAFGVGLAVSGGKRFCDLHIYAAIGVGLVLTVILASMWRTGH